MSNSRPRRFSCSAACAATVLAGLLGCVLWAFDAHRAYLTASARSGITLASNPFFFVPNLTTEHRLFSAVPVDGRARAELRSTRLPGIYRARYTVGDQDGEEDFAVNVDPVESDAARVEPEAAAEMLGVPGVRIVEDPGEIATVVRREREGLPLWDYLFAVAIAIAVAESLVANVLLRH